MFIVYSALALVGGVGTWYFNLQPMQEAYLAGWFANPASSSAAVDLIVVAIAGCAFIVVESRRVGMRWAWVLVPLSFLIAIAFTLPLFLAWREHHLSRTAAPAGTSGVRS